MLLVHTQCFIRIDTILWLRLHQKSAGCTVAHLAICNFGKLHHGDVDLEFLIAHLHLGLGYGSSADAKLSGQINVFKWKNIWPGRRNEEVTPSEKACRG